MDYEFETLKSMALESAKDLDPNLALGVALMSNFGRNHSYSISNIYSGEDVDLILRDLVRSGESRVCLLACVSSDGSLRIPPKSLCTGLLDINGDNGLGVQVYCPNGDGEINKRFLSSLVRIL